MARAFTEEERQRIDAEIRRSARERFAAEGARSALVEAIVAPVGIAKGSFYSFYPSKEELFLQILAEVEEESRRLLLARVAEWEFPYPEEKVFFFLREQYRLVDEIPFLSRNLNPETLRHIAVRVGPERFAEHQALDDRFYGDVARRWINEGTLDAQDLERIVALWKAPFWLRLHATEIGAAYEQTLEDLLHAVANYQTGGVV